MCRAESALHGNPILAPTREKVEFALDLTDASPMPLQMQRTYRSHRARDAAQWFSGYYQTKNNHLTMGAGWLHNHDIHLGVARVPADQGQGTFDVVRVHMGDGSFNYFIGIGHHYTARNPLHSLVRTPVQGQNGYLMTDQATGIRYLFSDKGQLVEQTQRNGWKLTYTYSGDQLSRVQGPFGRSLQFTYNGAGQLERVTTADQRSVSYGYSGTRLVSVRQTDASTRQYLYDDPQAPGLLSGTIDENGKRYATYSYDSEGWATATQKAGGVERYSVELRAGPVNIRDGSVTDPLGTTRSFSHSVYGNELQFTGTSGIPASASHRLANGIVFNQDGLEDLAVDFLGNQTTHTWNPARRLPISTTEAAGTTDARTTTTDWHPQWRLPIKVTEPGRVTTYTYDSLGNPLTQTTTDSATDSATGVARTWKWTYTSAGLVATETAPNGAVTTHTYDSAGNRTQSKNALGHVDSYTHDGAGRILTHTAPNGLVSTTTYDARGRLLSASQAGLTTTLTYTASGQIAQASLPSGHRITYTYDAAQRLVGWSDNRGASATYQLDAMGNRVQEEIKNSQGQTAWLLARSINSFNRVETTTVGSQNPTTYSYDANGDLVSASQNTDTSPETTTLARDALRRITQITNPENASASLAYNALDAITQASDYKNTTTGYQRDALGNATKETSADSGSQSAQYDSLGLLQSQTDALGRKHTVSRDALGRPTQVSHTSGASTTVTTTTSTLRYDLAGAAYNASGTASVGYLSETQDPGVTTRYQRDTLGRITQKTQILTSGDTRSTQYSYVPAGSAGAGSILAITYPSGKQLVHQYSASGQLSALQWNGQPLVSGITWNPLGQPTAWQWPGTAQSPGSSQKLGEQRSYTSAGQLASSQLIQINWNATGSIASLSQKHRVPAATGTAAQETTLSSAYSYNAAGRLTASAHSAPNTLVLPAGWSISDTIGANANGYAYDSNGNRSQAYYSTTTLAGTATLERTLQTKEGTNQLQSQTQTTTPAGGTPQTSTTSYVQDAGGALTTKNTINLTYSERGLLGKASTGASAAGVSYTYNSAGQRILKSDARLSATSPITEQTVYAEDSEGGSTVLGQYSNRRSASSAAPAGEMDSTETIYLQTATGPLPIAAQINGRTYAIHADHLNTARRLTNSQGQVAWQWVISGYGEAAPTTGAGGYAQPGLSNGKSYSEAVTYNLRYPGQTWDEETGLSYNLHRYYDKETGRYVTADPIGLDGGWNRFTYVDGNPLMFTDPEGLQRRPRGAPSGETYIGPVQAAQVSNLVSQIQRYDSNFRYSTIAPRDYRYNRQDVNFLTDLLRQYEQSATCTVNGLPRPRIDYGSTPNGVPFTRHYGTETGPVRRLPGSVLDEVIGQRPGQLGARGSTIHYDPVNNVTVVIGQGGVISAHRGPPE